MTKLSEDVARFFPYPEVRLHQDEFTRAISAAVEKGRSALVEGCNGLGKTVASLSACLPQATERDMKILFVARTHRQHDRVIEELKAISKKRHVSGISIRGRHEMCLNPLITRYAVDARAVMEFCALLKAKNKCPYYRNIEEKEHQYSEIRQQIEFHPYKSSEIQSICRAKGFCPYELVKSTVPDVDVIALSYLYVFDPAIRNAFLKILDIPLRRIILIVDEAHNLPETAVDIASSSLSVYGLKGAEIEAKKSDHEDIADFARIMMNEIEVTAQKTGKEALLPPEFLTELVQKRTHIDEPSIFFEQLIKTGNSIKRSLLADGKYPRSYIHGMGEFLSTWIRTAEDRSYIRTINKYLSKRGALTARLEIVALDPSRITEPVFSSVYSNIIMSGTLQPLDAFMGITRLPEDTMKIVVPSPFPKERVLPLICSGVTTAMEQRTPEMYCKIIALIGEVVQNTPANIGVFAASFEVLKALLKEGLENTVDKPLLCEQKGMSSRQNEKLVAEFKSHAKREGAVLLGVQGGRSSEGVDYPGDQMNSVIIVGIPYAEPTPTVKSQIDYFERSFPGFGREYSYVIPAMKRASQAAGRPMRTPEDRGAMIFLDQRFASSYCRSFFPSWIGNNLRILPDETGILARNLVSFFRRVS